jgi:hypothetical protein
MLEKLYELEKKIFEEFALETSDNEHVRAVDLLNPLTSICKIFLSDIVCSQLHAKPPDLPVIVPMSILIEDKTCEKFCYLKLNETGVDFIKGLFDHLDGDSRKAGIKKFRAAVLSQHGVLYQSESDCINYWSGSDESYSSEYDTIKGCLNGACEIPYNNSEDDRTKADEKVNYAINITHKLFPDSHLTGLTDENIRNFLSKISVLALHTKRNRKNFAEIETLATKAAISQVMARNMSHNIGSHVLSKYKSVEDFTTSEVPGHKQYAAKRLKLNSELNNEVAAGAEKLAATQRSYFNEYLKNRMDFLADIATIDHPTLELPLKFKQEVLKGFDKNRILLNRISGLDTGITFDIEVKLPRGDDVEVAIPNDVLGCQAFYIILENIIRNISKHGKRGGHVGAFDFLITIQVCEFADNKNYYEVRIVDDVSKGKASIDQLVASRNQLFDSPIIDPSTNRLRDAGLGSIEMDVCAAYLRKLPITAVVDMLFEVTNPHYTTDARGVKIPNLIHAYAHPLSDKEYSLGYKLYLRKPQRLLIIDDNQLNRADAELEGLRTQGVTILSLNPKSRYRFKPESEYSHEFLIWLNDTAGLQDFYEKHGSALPVRVLVKEDFTDGFRLGAKVNDTIREVWKTHLIKYLKHKGITGFNITQVKPTTYFPKESPDNTRVFIDNHDGEWEAERVNGYYEMWCSHHRLAKYDLFDSLLDRMRYVEAVATRVILIDERIQANIVTANKTYGGKVKFKEYFDQLGILIPNPEEDADLNRVDFGILGDECGEDSVAVAARLRHFLKEKLGNDRADFCVIHLGVIEKLFGDNEDKTEESVTRKIGLLVGEQHLDKVIITTGRGKPTNIAGRFRYVPLAVIQNYVETLFDKLLLVNALYNSRKSN